ncbi:MAG: tRNA preQ1(34) S-adenosylmethionine ribosyltransferase-isomerase QueA [Planctomycetes bacterium]|nr:tRNA preQ1(34) S-adenosylmethionine ribosyltransferase-isomerase QueA [Planctomycetota bacterium]
MKLSDFHVDVPQELIARFPLATRDACRLLVVEPGTTALAERVFRDVEELLAPGTVLVLNETQVVPARFRGTRPTGGKCEAFLVRPLGDDGSWEALVKAKGKPQAGEVLTLEGADGAQARLELLRKTAPGRFAVRFLDASALEVAERLGEIPLPPYLHREPVESDRSDYQTVFAHVPGAVAAPTAGLHFTPELLARLEARGVELVRLVLHVGLGTFMPVRVDDVTQHRMESERYAIPEATCEAVARAKREGRAVIACGTTVVRALEAYAQSGAREGATELFIYPPYRFRLVDGLITNFHLPESTLILLVAALCGRETLLHAYRHAIAEGFRFYSYGDAMLISPAGG